MIIHIRKCNLTSMVHFQFECDDEIVYFALTYPLAFSTLNSHLEKLIIAAKQAARGGGGGGVPFPTIEGIEEVLLLYLL
jgi:hypothetical protein